MRTTTSWRIVLTLTLGLAGMAACTSDDAADDDTKVSTSAARPTPGPSAAATTTSPSTSVAPATTSAPTTTAAATTTTASVGTGPAAACSAGQPPLLRAYDRASGAPGWSLCTTSSTEDLPSLVGATADLVYVVMIPQLRPQPQPAPGDTVQPVAIPTPQLLALDAVTGTERWRVELSQFGTNVAGPQAGSDVLVAVLGELKAIGTRRAGRGDRRLNDGAFRSRAVTPTLMAASADVVVALDPGAFGDLSGGSTTGPTALVLGADPRPGTGELAAYVGFARATGMRCCGRPQLAAPDEHVALRTRRVGEAGDGIAVVPLGPSALDLADGEIKWTATLPPGPHPLDPSLPYAIGPVQGGTALFGGQGKQLIAVDAATGQQRWTSLGSTVYDDVWAVDDTTVYLIEGADIVANDLASGVERWRQPQGDGDVAPWLAGGGDVFTMWWNLEARSADTGEVRWHTDYPTAGVTDGGHAHGHRDDERLAGVRRLPRRHPRRRLTEPDRDGPTRRSVMRSRCRGGSSCRWPSACCACPRATATTPAATDRPRRAHRRRARRRVPVAATSSAATAGRPRGRPHDGRGSSGYGLTGPMRGARPWAAAGVRSTDDGRSMGP